jgi:hypothetical protein
LPTNPEVEKDDFCSKNDVLGQSFSEVSPFDFYRYIFPKGFLERFGHQEDLKPNGLILEIKKNKHGRTYGQHTVFTDGLEQLEDALKHPCVICSPLSYYGRSRKASNILYMHALTLDIDYVSPANLKNLIHWMDVDLMVRPTFVVNSGHGVHLYYVFNEPIPMFKENQKEIIKLKQQLVKQIWTKHTSTNVQALETLGVAQGFRMVGSATKIKSCKVTAFKSGERVSIEDLNSRVRPEHQAKIYKKHGLTLDEAKEKYPDWYNRVVVRGGRHERWHVKRDLYDWYKSRVEEEVRFGHRYFCMMCLAIFAKKCDVSWEELERDALRLQVVFDEVNSEQPFTVYETYKALEAYNEEYITFPRAAIERVTALAMPATKRNGRKQEVHLKIARATQDIVDPDGDWRNKNGAPIKAKQVYDWRQANPEGNKSQCARATGLSRSTVIKWWGWVPDVEGAGLAV